MKKKQEMKERLIQSFSQAIIFLLIISFSTMTISAQSITVIVKDVKPLEISQIDSYVNLTETALDFVQPESSRSNIPELVSAEIFLAKLSENQLSISLVESNTVSKTYYERHTKKQQVTTITRSNYHILLNNTKDLDQFKNLINMYPNIEISSAKFKSKNEDATLNELTEELLTEANSKANKMAKMVGKKVSTVSNIKVLIMQTEGNPNQRMYYILEQKGYMELEETFDTENF